MEPFFVLQTFIFFLYFIFVMYFFSESIEIVSQKSLLMLWRNWFSGDVHVCDKGMCVSLARMV
jgi:hypothetical protein